MHDPKIFFVPVFRTITPSFLATLVLNETSSSNTIFEEVGAESAKFVSIYVDS